MYFQKITVNKKITVNTYRIIGRRKIFLIFANSGKKFSENTKTALVIFGV
jgi:hypothetical protein